MTSYVTPKKNAAFIFYASLPSAADPLSMKSSPTLASGDFKVSIDGGALANLTTLPTNTPASSVMVKFSLSASEMNGDNITIVCVDQTSPKEWGDVVVNLQTSVRQIDDLAYPATSGRSITVDASGNVAADLVNIAGAAVSTSTAQLGVNAVQAGATAWNSGAIKTTSFTAGAIDAAALAADAIGASELAADAASEIATAVWAAVTRTLTAGTNIALAKGVGVTGFTDLSAADVRTALGLAAANLDTQIATLATAASIAALNDLSAAEVLAAAYEGSETVQDFLRLARAALVGKASGLATTSVAFRDAADLKDRITATVDADGNRTAVTVDAT